MLAIVLRLLTHVNYWMLVDHKHGQTGHMQFQNSYSKLDPMHNLNLNPATRTWNWTFTVTLSSLLNEFWWLYIIRLVNSTIFMACKGIPFVHDCLGVMWHAAELAVDKSERIFVHKVIWASDMLKYRASQEMLSRNELHFSYSYC